MARLLEEVGKIEWDIIGLCETHRKGEGLSTVEGGHVLYDAGKSEEHPKARGLGFLINKAIKDKISNPTMISERVASLDINIEMQEKMTVVMVSQFIAKSSE